MPDPRTTPQAEPIVARIEGQRQLQVRLLADGSFDLSQHIPGGTVPISTHATFREAVNAAVDLWEQEQT